jgi:hypothetical protein
MPTHGEPGEGGRTMSGRIAEESSAEKCSVWGCERLSQTIAGEGLGVRLCRSHANAFQRHGSVDRRSFTATEIRPLRRIALEWIKANESDPLVAETIVKVRALYIPTEASGAGPRPGDPARAAWELRHISGLDPRKVMAARLAVEMAGEADPQSGNSREFKLVQTSKVIHRMATRTRRAWDRRDGLVEMNVYPHNQGAGLRYMGRAVDDACSSLLERLRPFMAVGQELP